MEHIILSDWFPKIQNYFEHRESTVKQKKKYFNSPQKAFLNSTPFDINIKLKLKKYINKLVQIHLKIKYIVHQYDASSIIQYVLLLNCSSSLLTSAFYRSMALSSRCECQIFSLIWERDFTFAWPKFIRTRISDLSF